MTNLESIFISAIAIPNIPLTIFVSLPLSYNFTHKTKKIKVKPYFFLGILITILLFILTSISANFYTDSISDYLDKSPEDKFTDKIKVYGDTILLASSQLIFIFMLSIFVIILPYYLTHKISDEVYIDSSKIFKATGIGVLSIAFNFIGWALLHFHIVIFSHS